MRFFAWCQYVWNITIWVFLGHFCCISLEILEWKFFKFVKMDQNLFHLIKQAFVMSKIKHSVIVYACCLNKTTKTMNKLTNEQPSSHFFFWLTPYIMSTSTSENASIVQTLFDLLTCKPSWFILLLRQNELSYKNELSLIWKIFLKHSVTHIVF